MYKTSNKNAQRKSAHSPLFSERPGHIVKRRIHQQDEDILKKESYPKPSVREYAQDHMYKQNDGRRNRSKAHECLETHSSKSAFDTLAALVSKSVYLSEISKENLVKANVKAAEKNLENIESSYKQNKSFMLSPQDLKKISLEMSEDKLQKDTIRVFLEKLYGKLPQSFECDVSVSVQNKRLPYSGSCFNKSTLHANCKVSPPDEWMDGERLSF